MPRTALTPKTAPGSYPTLQPTADSLELTMVAADVANKNSFPSTGKELVVAHNTSADTPHTVTVTSVADEKKRTGDITAYSIPFGEIHIFGPFLVDGWRQSDASIYLEASNAAIKFGVIRLP